MRTHRTLVTTAIAVLAGSLMAWLPRPALAEVTDISVGGVWVCRITHDASGFTAEQRAVEINRRITDVLSTPEFRKGAIVSVKPAGTGAVILVGNQLVFTVTPDDAEGTSVTPVELARQWAQRLAMGLSNALPGSGFQPF